MSGLPCSKLVNQLTRYLIMMSSCSVVMLTSSGLLEALLLRRSIQINYPKPMSGVSYSTVLVLCKTFCYSASELENGDCDIIYYVILRAVEKFQTEYGRYPGTFLDQVEPDIVNLKVGNNLYFQSNIDLILKFFCCLFLFRVCHSP